ncbi:MAG: hypothetical protein ACOZAQ_06685 [Pseudomonadota bacterium]
MNGLIPHSHAERMARAADKRRKILAFLRTEIWTSEPVIGELLEITHRSTVRATVQALVRDELITIDEVILTNGDKINLLGITLNGQAHAADLVGKDIALRHYEKGRVGISTIRHTLDLQVLRIRFARAGWKGWSYSDRVKPEDKNAPTHRSDALVTHPQGVRFALEVERHLKSKKRYEAIIGHHLTAIRGGAYERVLYATPTGIEGGALVSILSKVNRVNVAGQSVLFGEKERGLFVVTSYQGAPSLDA